MADGRGFAIVAGMHFLRIFPAVLLLASAVALGACGNKARPAQPTVSTAECAPAAQNTARLLAESMTGAPPTAAEQLAAAIERHCEDDGWSEDAQACIVTAADAQAMQACDPLLTASQKDAIDKEAAAIAGGGMGGASYGGATYGAATDGTTAGAGAPD